MAKTEVGTVKSETALVTQTEKEKLISKLDGFKSANETKEYAKDNKKFLAKHRSQLANNFIQLAECYQGISKKQLASLSDEELRLLGDLIAERSWNVAMVMCMVYWPSVFLAFTGWGVIALTTKSFILTLLGGFASLGVFFFISEKIEESVRLKYVLSYKFLKSFSDEGYFQFPAALVRRRLSGRSLSLPKNRGGQDD